MLVLVFCSFFQIAKGQGKKRSKVPNVARADSLFLKQAYAAAIPMYEEYLRMKANQSNVQAWNRLGVSCLNTNRGADAVRAFDEVSRLNPRLQGLYINRSKAYSLTNEIDKAIAMIDSAAQRNSFRNYKLLEQDPLFENLRKSPRYKAVYDQLFASAYPCDRLPQARQFDFWLGDWDVYLTSNMSVKAGFNRITKQSGGCVLLESWESQGPHSGVSINYYNPADSTWKQKWAGSGQDIQEFYDGKYSDGAMRFKWDAPNAQGRLTFTNLEPGKVRQHSEQSPDGGKTWQTVYDFTYILRK